MSTSLSVNVLRIGVVYRDAEMLRLSENFSEKSGTANVWDFSAKDSRMEGNTYTKEILRLTINALKREIALNFPYTQEFLGIGTISHLYYLLLLTFVLWVGLCLKSTKWPLVPCYHSWAARKSSYMCKNHMLGILDFTGSKHWAPFNFS